MPVIHVLPELPKASSPKTSKGKRKGCSVEPRPRHIEVPDEVVAGLKWLAQQGLVASQARAFYPGLNDTYYFGLRDGTLRRDVLPRCPPFISEHFWKERYRFPRDT